MSQQHKTKLINNYLQLCYEMSTGEFTDVDVDTIIHSFVSGMASKKHLNKLDLTEKLAVSTNTLRRKMQIKLHLFAEKLEREILEAGNKVQPEHQNRYRISDIQKIYQDFAGRSITRQTINTHTKPNSKGLIKLPVVHLPSEHTSVLQRDLIAYFYTETGIKLEPEEIKKYAYKTSVDIKNGEIEKGDY
jgi:hypothetical protein